MAALTVAGVFSSRMASRLLAVLAVCVLPLVRAENATVQAEDILPDWFTESAMTMSLYAGIGSSGVPFQWFVVPLTAQQGLNQSEAMRDGVKIDGNLTQIDSTNFSQFDNSSSSVAYISCDKPTTEGAAPPDEIINTLMLQDPTAIILYTLTGLACTLEGKGLIYDSIFTMTDPGDAAYALEILNNTKEKDLVHVTITGNLTESASGNGNGNGGNNSAVAMSILYSITGLITMLFLVIIATGAFRAHRYPERYGPRSSFGGRPRQSRAKGLARAVLDTIPIVKFGESHPPKADPAYDIENLSATSLEVNPAVPKKNDAAEIPGNSAKVAAAVKPADEIPSQKTTPPAGSASDTSNNAVEDNDHLGCSICTDDFAMGEDVRVLPCNHKFHPACVDPWLVDVSGTCPLCRLDLRGKDKQEAELQGEDDSLPPPLELDDHETTSHHRRVLRLFDVHRLRHASDSERLSVLRQVRTENAHDSDSDRGRHVRLTEKLLDKFKIRTRAQSPRNRTE